VGAGVRLVENEPGDAVVIARELEVAPGRARLRAAGERTGLEISRREYLPGLSHLTHAHLCWMRHHAAHSVCSPAPAARSVLPSPLWGGHRRPPAAVLSAKNADTKQRLCAEAQRRRAGWGSLLKREIRPATPTPTPNPSPQGGGEQTEFAVRA